LAGGILIVTEATIEKWVYGGAGLARTDRGVVLAPFTMPGEVVRVESGKPPNATLLEVVQPSPDRIQAPCPIFGVCGGCQYQHAPYEFQLARKVEILREQLLRIGKLRWDGEIGVISGPPYGYRSRAQFHLARGRIGYLAAGSHELVPVDGECPIASPRLNQGLEILRRNLRDPRFPRFVHSLELFTNETDLQVNVLESDRPVARWFYEWCGSTEALDYALSFATFRVSPRSFFQVNRFLVEPLVEAALPEDGGGTALDLFAGVGLFTVPLARMFRGVTAVEAGGSAHRDLVFNAQRAGVSIDCRNARVEDHLARLEGGPDFLLADPPRAGLGKAVTAHLERLRPERIAIISCDPATLARDLAGLGAYRVSRLTLVDLFPQTYHLEAVAHLVRK
jgi:23S rRNA (uracil1939-C5)-methyltransferase